MGLLWVLTVALAISTVLGDDSCPSPAAISPCTCDGEGMNCMGATSAEQIKKAFQAKFKYNGVRSVWIQGTSLTSVPSDLFGNIRTTQVYLEINKITTVDMRAFSASNKTLTVFSLFGNEIKTFPFEELSKFQRLGTVNLGRNQIETIPSGVLDSRSLNTLILTQNKISSIAMNAFSNLPGLARLELGFNSLTTLGPMSFAMKSHSAGLQINLSVNQISDVSASAFTGTDPMAIFFSHNKLQSLKSDTFGNLVTRIVQKGGFLEVSGNPFTCKGCDFNWLVLNRRALADRLVGFQCTDGRSLASLTKESIGC